MNVKYYAKDMQEALEKIKKELGPDAIIVSSKRVSSKKGLFGLFSPKVIEVIADYDPAKKRAVGAERSFKPREKLKPIEPVKSQNIDRMVSQALEKEKSQDKKAIAELDQKIDQLTDILSQFSTKVESGKGEVELCPELDVVYRNMLEQDAEPELAQELCQKAQELVNKRNAQPLEAMDHLLRELIGEVEVISHKKFERKVVMLIGPTGVGKTTTLVKLASYFVCKLDLKVGVINTDVYRVAAQEQLKTYAEILKVPMQTVYKAEELPAALQEFEEMDLVFIDTAGKVSDDTNYQQDVKDLLTYGKIDDIYLAVSGSTSLKNLKAAFVNYAFLKKHKIIVTKMDEGSNNGVLLNIRKYSGRPLSYITIGQSVPDDIQKVDVAAVISSMLRY